MGAQAVILKSEIYNFHRLDLTRQAGFIVTVYDEDGLKLTATKPCSILTEAFAEARKIVDNKIEGPAWTILSSWARLTSPGACKLMPAITTGSGRNGHWIKVRRSPVRFSRPEALNRTLSLVDFITITFESRFSVHTGIVPIGLAVGATEFLRVRSGRTPTRPVPSRHHSFIFLVLGFSILARSCEAMILAFKSAEYAAD